MPRARAILQSQFPYNISARCINREWFQLNMNFVWTIFCEQLSETSKEYGLQIHSFVLMANHFHLIASTPRANISECMWHFMMTSSRRLTRAGNRINGTFAGRHYKCILQSNCYFLNAYKYNYRNPVTAGVCENVEAYRYSTLRAVMGLEKSNIPLVTDATYQFDPERTLRWLNTAPTPEKLEAARYGFKHQYFKSKKSLVTNRWILGESDTL